MDITLRILGILSLILLLCTAICGAWMKSHPGEGDKGFHIKLSMSSVLVSFVTIFLLLIF
jgi:hypothetical protein